MKNTIAIILLAALAVQCGPSKTELNVREQIGQMHTVQDGKLIANGLQYNGLKLMTGAEITDIGKFSF